MTSGGALRHSGNPVLQDRCVQLTLNAKVGLSRDDRVSVREEEEEELRE